MQDLHECDVRVKANAICKVLDTDSLDEHLWSTRINRKKDFATYVQRILREGILKKPPCDEQSRDGELNTFYSKACTLCQKMHDMGLYREVFFTPMLLKIMYYNDSERVQSVDHQPVHVDIEETIRYYVADSEVLKERGIPEGRERGRGSVQTYEIDTPGTNWSTSESHMKHMETFYWDFASAARLLRSNI